MGIADVGNGRGSGGEAPKVGTSEAPRYHRLESPTQAPDHARRQMSSGEVWGRGVDIRGQPPRVKADAPELPDGAVGIEFTTGVLPDRGAPPRCPTWSPGRPGVRLEDGFAKIRVTITRCTQNVPASEEPAGA